MVLSPDQRAARRTALRMAAAALLVPTAAALLRLEAQRRGLLSLGQGLLLMTVLTVVLLWAIIAWAYRHTMRGLRQTEERNTQLREQAQRLEASRAEAQRAQERLQAALARVDLAEAVTQRGSWEWDLTTDSAVWSDGMYRLFGVDRATFENSNENFLALVLPEDRERMVKAIADALANPGPFYQEYRLRRPDDQLVLLQGQGRVVPDADGKASRLFGFVQDVTALRSLEDKQKQAEAQVRRAQERFARVFEASPVAIGLSRDDGRILEVNPAFATLSGYTREELLDPAFHAVNLYEDPEERASILHQLRSAGIVRNREFGLRRKDGGVRTCMMTLELVDVGGGTTILSLLQDVTELRLAREERERRIASEAEIERLRRTDQFRSEFINSTAHELSTPLTPLVLHARLLREDRSLTEAQKRAADAIVRSVARLHNVVRDMVQAADLQARTIALDRKRLNLSRLVAAAVAGHQDAAHRANVTLEAGPDAGLSVVADEARLQLAMGHLLGNALKFTPAGGRIVVNTRRDGDAARVEVHDTGVGLTQRQIASLWKPYAQAHDKAQRTDSGSGLGLYVTKGIIDLHRGEVGVSSPGPGHGTTFWFSLPLAPGNVDPLAVRAASEEPTKRANLNPGVGEEE
jgi:PAS domain S-box-containing protein